MDDVLAGIAIYATPLLGIGFLLRHVRLHRGTVLTLFLGAPALACATYVFWLRRNGIDVESSLFRELAFLYPFAILPLGLWVICLALLGSLIISRTSLGTASTPRLVGLGGALLGALVGGGFMGLYAALTNRGEVNIGHPLFSAWIVAGVVAGAWCGAIVGNSSASILREERWKITVK